MSKTVYSGVNIQYPISRLILDGKKIVETRTYPIPKKYVGQELIIIETPGHTKTIRSQMVGLITFTDSFKYQSKVAFYKDGSRHCVTTDSPWAWISRLPKWGWPITKVVLFKEPLPLQKRSGIVFSTGIKLQRQDHEHVLIHRSL